VKARLHDRNPLKLIDMTTEDGITTELWDVLFSEADGVSPVSVPYRVFMANEDCSTVLKVVLLGAG
jgi:hypothetical protein